MTLVLSPSPRYFPQQAFPPYTYVPRRSPHPQSDPAGHSYGALHSHVPPLDDANWTQHAAYLYGLDLFNYGYYWEAHESWESAWHAVGRVGPIADLLKALIHVTACGVKLREGRPAGVSHLGRAVLLIDKVRKHGATHSLGLALDELYDHVFAAFTSPPLICEDPPTVVRPLFRFALLPASR